MAAGVIYFLIALLIYLAGVEVVKSFVPPVVTGPIIVVIGLMLCPIAVRQINMQPDLSAVLTGNQLLVQWMIALFVVLVIAIVMIFTKGFFKLVPILVGIFSGYILCIIIDAIGISGVPALVNTAAITNADWFNFKSIFEGNFFILPKFNWSAIALIAPVAIVTFMEHIGDITTNGAVVKKDFFKEPGLHRTVIGDGIATMFAGFIGAPANTTYSENTGVLAVTKNYKPSVLRIAAIFAIILSLVGKFGAVLQTIPLPVMGGVSMVLFGMIASIGIRTLSEADLDFAHSRNLLIVALILTTGIGISVWNGPAGGGIQIGDTVNLSGLFIAALIGIVANKVLPKEL